MTTPFRRFRGIAAPLPLANVNTDAIIPSPFLRSESNDLARGLFARWRFDEAGAERPDFVLNRAPFRHAEILFAGENFGCGSSREAAVWALQRFGIRCVAAPSFADIFYENSFRNGLLAAVIAPADLAAMVAFLEAHPDESQVDIDLESQVITRGNDMRIAFTVPGFRRAALLRGDDEIAATLRHAKDIADFAAADRAQFPWRHRAIADTGLGAVASSPPPSRRQST
jgi:3-isopropylmalate/(R)-2-methylmalate dehydratase small subunit